MTPPNADLQRATDLMKEMGSPHGFDPIPPSQYLYFLDDPDPVQSAVAWVRSKTIRRGHRRNYAVDQQGNQLTIQDFANERYNGDWANANRAFEAAAAQKLVARDGEGKLYLCGNVPSRSTQLKGIKKQQDTEMSPVCANWSETLRILVEEKPYLRPEVENLPEEKARDFDARYQEYERWAKQLRADADAAIRAIQEQEAARLFGEFGLQLRNGKKRRPAPESLEVQLLLWPNYSAQTGSAHAGIDSAQSQDSGSRKAQNGYAHTSANKEAELQRTTTENNNNKDPSVNPEDLSVSEVDVVVVKDRLGVKHAAAEKFVATCRQAKPGVSTQEILETIHQVDRTINRRSVRNPTGILLQQVPAKLAQKHSQEEQKQPEPRRERYSPEQHVEAVGILADPKSGALDRMWARKVLDLPDEDEEEIGRAGG